MNAQRTFFFCPGLAEGDSAQRQTLGGKGASLATMSKAGLPVPPGFTIAAECCRLFLASGQWPEGLDQQVRQALTRLEQATGRQFGGGPEPLLVSVRSGSAVSMPGMMDTILNCGLAPDMAGQVGDEQTFWRVYCQFVLSFARSVAAITPDDLSLEGAAGPGDLAGLDSQQLRQLAESCQQLYARRTGRAFPTQPRQGLVECIEAVFASWMSDRAVAYRREHGVSDDLGTAVTVQAMFPARVSGIVFTTNPNDPAANEMVVESSYGLGEAVVSGDVHPDHFVLDRGELSVKRQVIGRKLHAVLALGDAGRHEPDQPSLGPAQLAELGRMALEVERFFGRPCDIEWGWADGRFALLQSRPIALEQAQSYADLLEQTRCELGELLARGSGPWVQHNLAETLPHPTALSWSVMARFMSGQGGFGEMYRMAGFNPASAVSAEGFLRLIAGRVYMDVRLAGEMFFEHFPYRYDLDLLRCDADAAQAPPTLPAGSLVARYRANCRLRAANRRLHGLADNFDARLQGQLIPAFIAWCSQEKRGELSGLSNEQLIQLWRQRRRRVMDEFAPRSLLPSLLAGMALADLRAFLAEHFWLDVADTGRLASLLSSPPQPDKTVLLNAALFALGNGQISIEQWQGQYGHRAANELDLAQPRWREQGQAVLALAERLRDGADPLAAHRRHQQAVRQRLDQLRRSLRPAERARLDELVRLARRYILYREDGKHYLMLGYDLLRDVALEAGKRLGIGDGVFDLTEPELLEALRTGVAPTELLAKRKALRRAQAKLALPYVIDSATIQNLGQPSRVPMADAYPAMAISAGIGKGPAAIVRSPQQAGELGRGYVLVCPTTDPAWTPLFMNAAALVLESGGTLSHGAIVAREMGIPAVVLSGATELLKDGQVVLVDGQQGLVSLAEKVDAQPAQGPAPDDVRIPAELVPPPPGRQERSSRWLRRACLAVWTVYLLTTFRPGLHAVHDASMAALDWLFWPMVRHLGKPATVCSIAACLAGLTMLLQRLLTDNARLREARRRAALLARLAAELPEGSPRRRAMQRLAAPVQVRLLGAAMVSLAVLLGVMVMSFVWLPARLDVANWNAAPGSSVFVVANVDEAAGPVSLQLQAPLALDASCAAQQQAPPVRATLEQLLATLKARPEATALPAGIALPAGRSGQELAGQLERYLAAGLPPQAVMWQVRAPAGAVGWFAATVTCGRQRLGLRVVLGDEYPPSPAEVAAPGQENAPGQGAPGQENAPIRSVKVVYPQPDRKRIFWAPLAGLGKPEWDAGWLLTYILAYVPAMFLFRRLLKVA